MNWYDAWQWPLALMLLAVAGVLLLAGGFTRKRRNAILPAPNAAARRTAFRTPELRS